MPIGLILFPNMNTESRIITTCLTLPTTFIIKGPPSFTALKFAIFNANASMPCTTRIRRLVTGALESIKTSGEDVRWKPGCVKSAVIDESNGEDFTKSEHAVLKGSRERGHERSSEAEMCWSALLPKEGIWWWFPSEKRRYNWWTGEQFQKWYPESTDYHRPDRQHHQGTPTWFQELQGSERGRLKENGLCHRW